MKKKTVDINFGALSKDRYKNSAGSTSVVNGIIGESNPLKYGSKEELISYYDFSSLSDADSGDLEFLKYQSLKIHTLAVDNVEFLGKIFYETQQRLSDEKYGLFFKWFTLVGFTKTTVYRYIARYKLVYDSPEHLRILIRKLPVSLSVEIANCGNFDELLVLFSEGKLKNKADLQKYISASKNPVKEIEMDPVIVSDGEFFLEKLKHISSILESKKPKMNKREIEKIENHLSKIEKILDNKGV